MTSGRKAGNLRHGRIFLVFLCHHCIFMRHALDVPSTGIFAPLPPFSFGHSHSSTRSSSFAQT